MPLSNPFDFTGQTVVMTGPTGALGWPIALAFADGGADLVVADVTDAAANKLAEEIRQRGRRALTLHVDVREPADIQRMVDRTLQEFGKIDVLVNLAGLIYRIPSAEHPIEKWDLQMDVNLKGTWLACQAVGKVMIEQQRGKIVNFASGAGFSGFVGYPAYSPAKAGVVSLTKVLAIEWGRFGINVNAVAPGFTDTPFNADVLTDPAKTEAVLKRMPVGRVLPANSQVGPTLFLASEAAKWITGYTIRVDGGFNAT